MGRAFHLCILTLLPVLTLAAQGGPVYTSSTPHPTAGASCNGARVQMNPSSGEMWCCRSGAWAACGPTYDASNIATVTASGATTPRGNGDRAADQLTVKDFGAKGDGSTDDRAALALASASARTILVTAGTYRVASGLTFSVPVRVAKGAVFSFDPGVVVTFSGGFDAGAYQVFAGTGAAAFDHSKTSHGKPEWWGAVPNAGDTPTATANVKAIMASVAALPVTELQLADYFVVSTVTVSTPYRTIRGEIDDWKNSTSQKATRVIVQSATLDTMFIGFTSNPGGINSNLRQIRIEYLDVTRDRAPTPATAGNEFNGPAGIRQMWTLWTELDHVRAVNHEIGFVLSGTVRAYLNHTMSTRDSAGSSPTNDQYWGYFLNGNSGLAAAGGNASTYMTDCGAEYTGTTTLTDSYGLSMNGKPADTFVTRFESAGMNTGIVINGDSSQAGNADVHIVNPIIDTFRNQGLYITNVGPYGAVNVTGGYFAAAGGAASPYGIRIVNSTGMTALTNNQTVCWGNSACMGMWIDTSQGVVARSNMHLGSARPIILSAASNNVVEDIIANPTSAPSPTQAAVYLFTASSRNKIAPVIKGQSANRFPKGVGLEGNDNTYNEIVLTGIDPGAITGGATNKLQINSTAITATGCYSAAGASGACGATYTNLVSGMTQ